MSDKSRYIVLFDIGGVLIEFNGITRFAKWVHKSPEYIKSIWPKIKSVRNFSKGKINLEEFYNDLKEEWKIEVSISEFSNFLKSMIQNPFPEMLPLLIDVKKKYKLACITNTNEIQWPIVKRKLDVDIYFDYSFISYELGMVKPDLKFFDYVIEKTQTPPSNIIFFDDSLPNINNAKSIGINSCYIDNKKNISTTIKKYLSQFS